MVHLYFVISLDLLNGEAFKFFRSLETSARGDHIQMASSEKWKTPLIILISLSESVLSDPK